jgi:hypothetical protein
VYTGAPERKTGSILAPPFDLLSEESVRATASNLDTSLGRGPAEECACC